MRSSLISLLVPLCSLLAAATPACSDTEGSSTGGSGDLDAGAPDAAPQELALRIEPPEAAEEVVLGAPAQPTISFKAFAKRGDDPEEDVTAKVAWAVGNTAIAGIGPDGLAQLKESGGKTEVRASLEGVMAAAPLTVKLRGDVFLAPADASTKADFDAASADPDPQNAPSLEYPEDGAVLPLNLPPIEAQWSQASDNSAYRVRVTSPDTLDIALYTTGRELLFPSDVWAKIAGSSPDQAMALSVDGIGPAKMLRAGAPRALTVASDPIDASAIYVWQSSTGSFRVLDVIAGTDIPLPTDSPALAPGQPCSGCHRISRDGRRFSYSFNGSNFQIGTLTYDDVQKMFVSKIAPAPGVRGTYATFNPNESTTTPAMLLSVPDDVAQNSPGTTRLMLVDPETNAPVPSNVAEMITQIDPAIGRATLMPDWSPAGDFVVFTAYNSDANYVRELGDDVVLSSIVEAPVTYNAQSGAFQFGAPKVLVTAPAGGNPDTGENNFLPSISPDGSAVAFTRSAGWWSIKTQQTLLNLSGQIMIVRRSDGAVIELSRGSNGGGTTLSSTWPQWAPTLGKRYAWLAYASERPYGHKLTAANSNCGALVQGQKQCKQLWITAVDLQKLASSPEDPSSAPFWIPGQSVNNQYVSPQWTKAVLPVPQ